MKKIKGITKILIILVMIVVIYFALKQCLISYINAHEDEFAKMFTGDAMVRFGDGTYQILNVQTLEGKDVKDLYPLCKVIDGVTSYLNVEEYTVINHIAYIKGWDEQDNSIKLFAILDYNNDKIKVENSINKFSSEEINIFENEEFINFYEREIDRVEIWK